MYHVSLIPTSTGLPIKHKMELISHAVWIVAAMMHAAVLSTMPDI